MASGPADCFNELNDGNVLHDIGHGCPLTNALLLMCLWDSAVLLGYVAAVESRCTPSYGCADLEQSFAVHISYISRWLCAYAAPGVAVLLL